MSQLTDIIMIKVLTCGIRRCGDWFGGVAIQILVIKTQSGLRFQPHLNKVLGVPLQTSDGHVQSGGTGLSMGWVHKAKIGKQTVF